MDYFNLAKFIKSVVYNFVRMFKYLSYCLIAICFIAVCLLLMSSKSKAETFGGITESQAMIMVNALNDHQSYWFKQGNAVYSVFYYPQTVTTRDNVTVNATYWVYGWLPSSSTTVVLNNTKTLKQTWNQNTAYSMGYFDSNFNWLGDNVFWFNSGHIETWDFTDYLYQYNQSNVSNFRLYYEDTTTEVQWNLKGSSFVDPIFLNAEDNNWSNTLVTGEFNYFFIDGNSAGNGEIPLSFIVEDITTANENNNLYSDSWTQAFILTPNSSYRYAEDNGKFNYAISKDTLKFGFLDNHAYHFSLSWQVGLNTQGKNWDITTDFSAESSLTDEQRRNIEMIQGIKELNNSINDLNNSQKETNDFLNNTTFDNSIVQMPSIEFNENFTTYGDRLFIALKNAFTGENYKDFEFTIPFSNGQKIVFPSSYIEEHLPNVIIVLIRMVYWYVIGRYVLKNILHTIDRLRQGDYFLKTEDDIKTEVL